MTRQNSKDIMLPHSRAKVKFYKTYLDLYLKILCNSPYITEINIYDIFCGRGIYKDGGKGSPIEAANVIYDVCNQFPSKTKIKLHVNDKCKKHINNVRNYLQTSSINTLSNVEIVYSTLDGETVLEDLSEKLNCTPQSTRNLIFIDPYGYKEIKKEIIYKLLQNQKTEVMIFLPISFMNRFTPHALENEEMIQYKPLCDFVKSFFTLDHPVVKGEIMTHLQYIDYLTKALRFNNHLFSTSYHIERSIKNYFALFFITPNKRGYEKILETKWSLDEKDGNGFELPKERSLFEEEEKEEDKRIIFNRLFKLTNSFLANGPKDNTQLHDFVIYNEYLPKHLGLVLSEMLKLNLIKISKHPSSHRMRIGFFYLSDENKRIIVEKL